MDSDIGEDESVLDSQTELGSALEQLRYAKEQIETYQMLNRDLSNKVQEFKVAVNAVNSEINLLRDDLMREKIKSSELRRTLRVLHEKFTFFYGDYAAIMKRCVENTDLDLAVTSEGENQASTSEGRAQFFKPPNRVQGCFANNETNVLNTIREEQESHLSALSDEQTLIPQPDVPLEMTTLDIQYETEMFPPLGESLPTELSAIDEVIPSVSKIIIAPALLRPKVFINDSNISCFSIASDATSTPLPTLNLEVQAKSPLTILEEEDEDEDSSQQASNGFIGETPRRRSGNAHLRPPPARRISEETVEEDYTQTILLPEGSVEQQMRLVFGEDASKSDSVQEMGDIVDCDASNDSSNDPEITEGSQEGSPKYTQCDTFLPTRRKSSCEINEILDEIQEANTSNKENSLPSPQSTHEYVDEVSPSEPSQKGNKRPDPRVHRESPMDEAEPQQPKTTVIHALRRGRGRPRKISEIATDEEDEPPKKIQKSPTKTLRQRNPKTQVSGSEDGGLPIGRANGRRKVVQEISSEDQEEFKDAQPDVQESASEADDPVDIPDQPIFRSLSIKLSQLNPSQSMLEAFQENYVQPATRDRSTSIETLAESENADATDVADNELTGNPSTAYQQSEMGSEISISSTDTLTASQAATTSRKRKPKKDLLVPQKSRPPRRKARLPPGSLMEKSLNTKLRRSK